MKSIRDCFRLKNGVEIPCVGYGTWIIPDSEAEESVKKALKAGYRHIDTAAFYGNEQGIGRALRASGIAREEIFVTSKVWNDDQGYENCRKAFAASLERLKLEYLDLYLIHWPVAYAHRDEWEKYLQDTWRAMEELYEEGKIRAIGVCNCKPHHLQAIMEQAATVPLINQVEYHPGMIQEETSAFCRRHEIQMEAWAPLARKAIFEVEELQSLSDKYHKSAAQIVLRWELQKGVIPLPKSSDYNRMLENSRIFDFELEEEDLRVIDAVADCKGTGQDPDTIDF